MCVNGFDGVRFSRRLCVSYDANAVYKGLGTMIWWTHFVRGYFLQVSLMHARPGLICILLFGVHCLPPNRSALWLA